MTAIRIFVAAALLAVSPLSARAEGDQPRPFAWDVARAVLIDPTTFAPAVLGVLQYSTANNASVAVVERLLVARYPQRKTLIRTLSWVERIAFASILTYRNSTAHLRQASTNRRLAREYGYTGS